MYKRSKYGCLSGTLQQGKGTKNHFIYGITQEQLVQASRGNGHFRWKRRVLNQGLGSQRVIKYIFIFILCIVILINKFKD